MRKAGAKEDIQGSFGFEGAINVKRCPVSTKTAGRRSDLMIQLCSCTGRSSSLRNPNNTNILMTCKDCGGESIHRGQPSCSSKLDTIGLEFLRSVDPGVRWKTVNRRPRAARRARTSFFGEDRMNDAIRSFYLCGSATSQDMAQKDAPVSEYEKLGASILGRRFGDPLENVPIKKRRFHIDCSPSPPLPVDPCEKILSRSYGGISSENHHEVKMQGCEEKKGAFETADFSGISILAAAACESEMDVTILNGEYLKSAALEEKKTENLTGTSESRDLHEIKDDKLSIPDASHCKLDNPLKSSETGSDMKPSLPTTLNNLEFAVDTKPLFHTTLNSLGNTVVSAAALKVNSVHNSSLSSANKTNDFSSAFDPKSSDITMSNSSSNPDKFVGCLGDVVVQTKAVRDSRLHWDLNVAMESWDTHSGDCYDHDIVGFDHITSVPSAEKEAINTQARHDLFDSTIAGDISEVSGEEIHVVDIPNDLKTEGGSEFPGDGSSYPLHGQSLQNLQLLESESLDGNGCSTETNDLPEQQKSNYAAKVELHLGSNSDFCSLAPITEHIAFAANVDNLDVSHVSPLDYDGSYHLAFSDFHGGGSLIQTSELGLTVKPMTSRLVSEESTNVTTVTVSNKSYTDIGCSDDKIGQAYLQSISEFKSQELLDVDSGTSKVEQSVSDRAEHGNDVLNVAAKRAASADNDLIIADPHSENNLVSSHCDLAHVHGEAGTDATINKKCLITCANSSSAETHCITSHAPRAFGLNSECNKQASTDMDSVMDSQCVAQSYPNGNNKFQKVASNNILENCHGTGTYHICKDLPRAGKVDAEEDDSQYEDGELRESGDLYWPDDEYEEVKCVSYKVSDYKNEEVAPDIRPELVGSSKRICIPVGNYNGTLSRKEDGDVSPVSSKRSWSNNCLDDGSGTMCVARAGEKARSVHPSVKSETLTYEINPVRLIAGSAATANQSERGSDPLGDDPSSIRTKSTGWDTPPEDQRHSRHPSRDGADSSNLCVLGTLGAAEVGESFQQMGSSNRDVQSRLDRSRSFNIPCGNEQCRSDDGYDSGSKFERTIDAHISHGRGGGASRHIQIQVNVRGEKWVENSNSSHSNQRGSPDYYNYGPPGPRNAVEAAVAKMESSGFVVAPDGTLVKAVDAANASNISRRMRNTSSSYRPLSGRCSPVERDGGCELSRVPAHAREAPSERRFGASCNPLARYDPKMDTDHTADGNMSSVRYSLSNRQRRFPPHRASLNLSRAHSRSPSGSWSRSPHAWISPRNRREIMANGGSSTHRHSRSLNYIAEVRAGRMTSPRRQPRFSDRVMLDSSSSRNHTYSQHVSTWVDGRNCSTLDTCERKKQYSKRSPPPRITSRNGRFDVMESQAWPRSGEFHRPTQERLSYGFERGNKHVRNGDDNRECGNRCETAKPHDQSGTVKQFRNHTGDKLHPRISTPRSP